jgi:hypothetical protein
MQAPNPFNYTTDRALSHARPLGPCVADAPPPYPRRRERCFREKVCVSLVGGAAASTVALAGGAAAAQRCPATPPIHTKGPAVWLDHDQQDMDAMYDQSVFAFNQRHLLARAAPHKTKRDTKKLPADRIMLTMRTLRRRLFLTSSARPALWGSNWPMRTMPQWAVPQP